MLQHLAIRTRCPAEAIAVGRLAPLGPSLAGRLAELSAAAGLAAAASTAVALQGVAAASTAVVLAAVAGFTAAVAAVGFTAAAAAVGFTAAADTGEPGPDDQNADFLSTLLTACVMAA